MNMCFELINVKTLLSDIEEKSVSTSYYDATINKLLRAKRDLGRLLRITPAKTFQSALYCWLMVLLNFVPCFELSNVKTMPRRSQGQLVGGGQWRAVYIAVEGFNRQKKTSPEMFGCIGDGSFNYLLPFLVLMSTKVTSKKGVLQV